MQHCTSPFIYCDLQRISKLAINNVCFVSRNGYYKNHSINGCILAYSLISFNTESYSHCLNDLNDSRSKQAFSASAKAHTHSSISVLQRHTMHTGRQLLQLRNTASKKASGSSQLLHSPNKQIQTQCPNYLEMCEFIKVRLRGQESWN